ncbi:hypothetical protein HYV31_02630 [candidate division WWE3 bacterium]|nr:hypothetical protein [candidate division WWE3 bacterium]
MQFILTFFLIATFFRTSFPAYAQSSAFGVLTDEKNMGRENINLDGHNLASYEKALDEYIKLNATYTKSYGPQKTILEKQVLGKAKDVMTTKLGAVLTFLQNLKTKSIELGLMTDEDKSLYDAGLAKYQNYAAKRNEVVANLNFLLGLKDQSAVLNKEILEEMQFSEVFLARISVTRGRFLIARLMELAPVIQAQISTSSDVGGDVREIQMLLDDSMLILEGLKDSYSEIEKQAAMVGIAKTSDSNFMGDTRIANAKMVIAYNGIVDVVSKLKILYATAPWDEKLVEQLLFPPDNNSTKESSQSTMEDK